jgi:hypothetical protein
MKKIIVIAAALFTLAGVSAATATASSASVCEPNGAGCTQPGDYPGLNALISSDYSGFQVVWTESVVQQSSSGVPVYWTAYLTYTNIGSSTLTLGCPGDWPDSSYVSEHMSGGSGDDGTVSAAGTSCSENPGLAEPVPPGGTYTLDATFNNVPWPGSAVAITWGSGGTSPYVYPFGSSPPAVPAPSGISGEACVFNAPYGVTHVFGKTIGHVGWGFRLPSGNWEFGANEGPGNLLLISNTWYATGTRQQMLMAFRDKGHHHNAKYYTQYKCTSVNTTNADIEAAGTTVGQEYNELYAVPGRDCESQVYNVLAAYGVNNLPSDTSPFYALSPDNWFNHLSGAGFGGATPL